jgi:broad specificity phosphatase PhoE
MRIYFVRHGQSQENAGTAKDFGAGDYLTDAGWKQAEQLGERLKDISFSTIYASPMRRAQETALAICDYAKAPITIDEDIHEIVWHTGPPFAGERSDALRAYLKHWDTLATLAPDESIDGAESFAETESRTKRFMAKLEEHDDDESILVVSHGGFIRTFLGMVIMHENFGPPGLRDMINRTQTINTGISEFDHSPERGWVLHTWMDQAHL